MVPGEAFQLIEQVICNQQDPRSNLDAGTIRYRVLGIIDF